MANQFLALALFLMMLSFFIIMNGISSYDDAKKELVLNSVSQAFSHENPEIELAPVIEPTLIKSMHTGDSLAEIEGLFGSHISNFKASKNRLGTTMHVSLPYESFKETLNAEQNEVQQNAFLPTMISLMRSEQSGVPYKVDIVLGLTDPAQANMQTIRDVASITSILEDYGLPKKLMSAGFGKGKEGVLDLFFERYRPYDPMRGDKN